MTHWTIDLAWQYLLTRSLISMLGSFWARNFWYLNCKKHVNFYFRIHFKSSRSWNFLKCLIFYNSYFLNLGTRILFLSCGWVRPWSLLILVPRATQLNLQPTSGAPRFKTMWPKKRRALGRRMISTPQTLHQTTSRVLDVITPSLHSQLIFFTQVPLQRCLNEICSDDKFHAKCSRTSIISCRFGLSTQEDAKSWLHFLTTATQFVLFFKKTKTHHVLDRSTRLRTVLVKPIALVIKRRLNSHFNKVWNYLCDVIL